MTRVSRRRLLRHIERMQGVKVLVVGDFMLDKYVWGTVSRVSPEAPVPVLLVEREEYRPGGAGNVAANVAAMGGVAIAVGVRGEDAEGLLLLEVLGGRGVLTDGVVPSQVRPTTVKCRVIAHSQQVVRMDRESTEALSPADEERLLAACAGWVPQVQAVILQDYNKGVLTPRVIDALISSCRERDLIVAVDPKVENFSAYRHVTLLKPNQSEVERFLGRRLRTEEELVTYGASLRRRQHASLLLVTRGERGMVLFGPGRAVHHIPTKAREVYDVSGAGDTVVSVMTLALAAGARPLEGAFLANAAAGICVSKVGTQPVSRAELEADVRRDGTLG